MDARTGLWRRVYLGAWERGQESADLQGIYAKCWRAWR